MYTKAETEPLCFKREIKVFKADKGGREFGDSTHQAWETFMKTVTTKDYQNVVNGTMYKGLTPQTGEWNF